MNTILVQARLPRKLVEKLDELVEEGLFSSRSEAVAEAVRRLVLEYDRLIGEDVVFVEKYIAGRKPRVEAGSIEVDLEEARRKLREVFGSDRVEDALARIRGRIH